MFNYKLGSDQQGHVNPKIEAGRDIKMIMKKKVIARHTEQALEHMTKTLHTRAYKWLSIDSILSD